MSKTATTSFMHRLPADMKATLGKHRSAQAAWDSLTPLAKNEWICWVTIPKQAKTRAEHLTRLTEELSDGKRRPCCWPGCPHRRPDAKKWFEKKPKA